MRKPLLVMRTCLLIYLLILLPFFHFAMPIRFLLIDSFLAYLPIEFYFALGKVKKTSWIYVCGFLYLLFLPNNLYLLTDLIHLSRISFYTKSIHIMTENGFSWLMFSLLILGVFCLTWIGFQTEIEVIRQLKTHYNWPNQFALCMQILLFVVVSCGVFLGRFLRLNSIQLLTNLPQMIDDSIRLFTVRGLVFIGLFTGIQLTLFGLFNLSRTIFPINNR